MSGLWKSGDCAKVKHEEDNVTQATIEIIVNHENKSFMDKLLLLVCEKHARFG